MNIKSIITALTLTLATTSIAAADVSVSGQVSGGVVFETYSQPTVRDHRAPAPAPAPAVAIRDHRGMWTDWRRPVVQPAAEVQPTMFMNRNFSLLAMAHLDGNRQTWDSQSFDMRHVANLGQLTFKWAYGKTGIKQVTVRYANGTSKTYNLGDSLTEGAKHHLTRTIQLEGRATSITVIGYGMSETSRFEILGRSFR